MFNSSLYGNQVPFSRKYVRDVLSSALAKASQRSHPILVAELNHSHTDAHDFIQFINRGAQIFISTSGVVLQNLAIRCSVNKMSKRPVLLWQISADYQNEQLPGQGYLLGEEIEASITGSDGIIFHQNDIVTGSLDPTHLNHRIHVNADDDPVASRLSQFTSKLQFCKEHGLTTAVTLTSIESLGIFLQDKLKPDLLFIEAPGADLSRYIAQASKAGVVLFNTKRLPSETKPPNLNYRDSGFANALVVDDFSGLPELSKPAYTAKPIVKVCGVKTVEAAKKALDSGASMIGMILVPGRSRSVDLRTAKAISHYVHQYIREPSSLNSGTYTDDMVYAPGLSIFESRSRILQRRTETKPMIVGVFRNQSLSDILNLQKELNLDIVQLHGSEPLDWCKLIPVPVIKRFTPGTPEFKLCSLTDYHYLSLLDGEVGGEGLKQDWEAIREQVDIGARFVIAGGLDENNVHKAVTTYGSVGVDVSGGVETNGEKDMGKIERFVRNAKNT